MTPRDEARQRDEHDPLGSFAQRFAVAADGLI
jgi:hypothetical protein